MNKMSRMIVLEIRDMVITDIEVKAWRTLK